jgi:uncharacterized Zn-finger protein
MRRLINSGKQLYFKGYFKSFSSKTELIQKDLYQDNQVQRNQAPNRATVWSNRQQSKSQVYVGPRFTQIDIAAQPNPLAAIELIKADPIRHVKERQVICKGDDNSFGHPNIFINLVHTLKQLLDVYVFIRIMAKLVVVVIVGVNLGDQITIRIK